MSRPAVRCATGLVTLTVTVGLSLVALPHAAAAPPIWSVHVATVNSTMPGSGGVKGFEATCPSGQTPVAGSYIAWGSSNVQRLSEEVGWGSGTKYSVTLKSGPNNVTSDISVRAYCVPTSYFSDSVLKFGVFTANSSGVAAGTVACDPGWFSLSARVTFSTFAGGPVRTSTPDMEFDAWFAVGTAPSGSQMTVAVRCVPAWNMSNARFASHSVAIGSNGAEAFATCPTGMLPIVGGTWQDSGSGAVTTQPQPFLPTRQWTSRTYGGTGTMRTNVVCVPGQVPTVTVNNGAPKPSPNSTAASWTFTAQDPAAAGGYTLSTACSLDSGPFVPCTSPVERGSLTDGTHTMDVRATTSDGRVSAVQRGTVRIDTTAPTVTFPDPVIHVDDTPATRVSVADADPWVSFRCAVDGGEEASCGGVQVFNGSATTTVSWPGPMADGQHVLRLTATDGRGNATNAEHAFTVDTVAPQVTQKTPASRFTVGTAVKVAWSGSDATSGIASYDVRWRRAAYNRDFGPWTTVTSPATATSRRFGGLARGSTYCFSVRAVDHAGHSSPWTPGRCTAIPLDDRDLARSSGWSKLAPSGWFQRTALATKRKGATLSITGATLKRVAFVAKKCPSCGVVGIFVKGTRVGKVDLAGRTTARRTILLPAFSERTGTVTIKVLSSGRPVQIDALGTSRQ